MKYLAYIGLLIMLSGCQTVNPLKMLYPGNWFSEDRHDNKNYAPTTKGGNSIVEIDQNKGTVKVAMQQPENTADGAGLKVTIFAPDGVLHDNAANDMDSGEIAKQGQSGLADGMFKLPRGGRIEIETTLGSSSLLEFNETKFGDYSLFVWLGAVCCLGGIAITVASLLLKTTLIPLWVGPAVFFGGAITAYMTEAIPRYGPWCIGLVVLVAIGYAVYYLGLRKHHPKLTRVPFSAKKDSPIDD